MRLGLALVLGLMLVVPATAEASRQEQGARQQATRGAPQARPAATAPRQAATPQRPTAPRAAATRAPARQPDALRATNASRNAIPYRGSSRDSAQVRDRSGRLVADTGFNRAVLRGQQARLGQQQCQTVNGRRACGMTRQVSLRWQGGLAPAAGHQSQCPDGTMAMLALGHENVYRCVPF